MSRSKGFSLLEMVVVLVIMGTIAVVMYPMYQWAEDNKRTDFAIKQVEVLEGALNEYYLSFCGQATFPQPTLSTLQAERLIRAPFQYPVLVDNVQTAIYYPNTPRATLSVIFEFDDSEPGEEVLEIIQKKSDNSRLIGEHSLEFRSLTEINSTPRGARMKENRDNHSLAGC